MLISLFFAVLIILNQTPKVVTQSTPTTKAPTTPSPTPTTTKPGTTAAPTGTTAKPGPTTVAPPTTTAKATPPPTCAPIPTTPAPPTTQAPATTKGPTTTPTPTATTTKPPPTTTIKPPPTTVGPSTTAAPATPKPTTLPPTPAPITPCPTPPPTPALPANSSFTVDVLYDKASFSEQLATSGEYLSHLLSVLQGAIPPPLFLRFLPSVDNPNRYGMPQGLQTRIGLQVTSRLAYPDIIKTSVEKALENTESVLYIDGVRNITIPKRNLNEEILLSTPTVSGGWYALIVLAVIVSGLLVYVFSRNRAATSEHKDVEHANDDEENAEEDEKLQEQLMEVRKDEDNSRDLEKLLQRVEALETRAPDPPPPGDGPRNLPAWLKQDGDFQLPPRVKAKLAAKNLQQGVFVTNPGHLDKDMGLDNLWQYLQTQGDFKMPPWRRDRQGSLPQLPQLAQLPSSRRNSVSMGGTPQQPIPVPVARRPMSVHDL
eukprot:PhF_6_TR8261/c3_g1_i3/m.12572